MRKFKIGDRVLVSFTGQNKQKVIGVIVEIYDSPTFNIVVDFPFGRSNYNQMALELISRKEGRGLTTRF